MGPEKTDDGGENGSRETSYNSYSHVWLTPKYSYEPKTEIMNDTTVSQCHLATITPYHHDTILCATMPPCHPATLPLCHRATVPTSHFATMPPCDHATVPPCHRATVPPCHPATVQPCHPATVPSCHHTTMPPVGGCEGRSDWRSLRTFDRTRLNFYRRSIFRL